MATTRRNRTCTHVATGETAIVTVGEYRGTLTDPLSSRYSGWDGNVEQYDGQKDDGQPVTVYYRAGDCRVPPRFSE